MARRCRAFDWTSTPLGAPESWPTSLRTIVAALLASRQPMFLWWGQDLVQFHNDAYAPSLGTGGRAEHALGAKGREFWTDIWTVIGPQIEQVMTTGVPTWHVDQYLPIERNGRLDDVWWTYSYSPVLDDDGAIAGTLVICQETTAQVIAERELAAANAALAAERAQLGTIVERAPAFIAVLRGPEHRFERTNAEYDQLLGKRVEPGLSVAEAMPEVVDQGFIELLNRVLETGEPFIGRAVPLHIVRTAGGAPELRHIDFVYQALTEADGTRSGIFVHGVDVTNAVEDRHAVERLLVESEAARREAETARGEAETASRAKGEFLAVMSHELRTPLNAIAGYAELIEMELHGPVTAEQRTALMRIQESQRALLSMINEVLSYARLEAGTVSYSPQAVSVAEAMRTAEVLVLPQLRARGLAYHWQGCDPALAVHADRDKLQQILLNLLSNAIKFTPGDGARAGRITVGCEVYGRDRDAGGVSGSGATVRLTVADSGIGIAANKLGTIFEPFVQVDQRLTRDHTGTGLGLAISRDLARGMGGDLVVDSVVDQGSVFTLILPVAEEQSPGDAP